jgi:hypothetical protein
MYHESNEPEPESQNVSVSRSSTSTGTIHVVGLCNGPSEQRSS